MPPLEQKESFKWANGAEVVDQTLPKSVRKTYVYECEGDIYEAISRIKSFGSDLVVRSRFNRHTEDGMLWDSVPSCEPASIYKSEIRRKGKPTKTALMELRWQKTTIKSPVRPGYQKLSTGLDQFYTWYLAITSWDALQIDVYED